MCPRPLGQGPLIHWITKYMVINWFQNFRQLQPTRYEVVKLLNFVGLALLVLSWFTEFCSKMFKIAHECYLDVYWCVIKILAMRVPYKAFKMSQNEAWWPSRNLVVFVCKMHFFWIMKQLQLIFSTRNIWIMCLKFYGITLWIPVCMCVKGYVWMAIISGRFWCANFGKKLE